MVGFQFGIFMYSDNIQIKESIWSQASRRCPWRILAKSKTKTVGSCATIRTGLWRRLDAPQCPADNDEDVRTSEQHRPDARLISIQQGVGFQKSTLFGSLCKPFRWCLVFQNILEFRSNAERILAKTVRRLGQAFLDLNLIKIELSCFWKDIAENSPDVANFRPDAR
jgi:hypothetical protein